MEDQVEVPTTAPAPAPEETPAPAPEETPAPAPEDPPAPAPEETSAPAPEETSAPAPEETPAPAPEETPAPAPEDPPAPAPEDTLSLEEITPEMPEMPTEASPTEASQPPAPEPEDILTLEDILNDQSLKQAKEDADRTLLLSISTQSTQALKPILVQWAQRGFPAAYPIYSVNVTPPSVCLDGVTRSLYDYITYVSGKTIAEHVCDLCCKLQGMTVGFANINGIVTIVVTKD